MATEPAPAPWIDTLFQPQTLLVRHAQEGDLIYPISGAAKYMLFVEDGSPRLALEIETAYPPPGHPLAVLGKASLWIWGVELSSDKLEDAVGRIIPCNDWFERGDQEIADYVCFNLHSSHRTWHTSVRLLTPRRLQVVTVAEDVNCYDHRARPNPVYVDVTLAGEPAELDYRL